MASASKLVKMAPAIELELKAFIDEVLVPMLVRDALNDLAAQKSLALKVPAMAHFASTALRSAEEMA